MLPPLPRFFGGCSVVSDGSVLRVGKTRAFPKCPQQLFERPYLTTPYMGRGFLRPNEESELIFSEDTKVKRSCNTLSGISVPQIWTPMIDHISFNIQNEKHIVQEVFPGWRRGGDNSRSIIKNVDYNSRCGKAYMQRSTNSDFWAGKSQLLNQ